MMLFVSLHLNFILPLLFQTIGRAIVTVASECAATGKDGECSNVECLDVSTFQKRVASSIADFDDNGDESILQSLRGTVDGLLPKQSLQTFVESLPMSEFVQASGYDGDDNNDNDNDNSANSKSKMGNGRAYSAPTGYAGLGLKELSRINTNSPIPKDKQEERYNQLLQIREIARSTTEKSLGLCDGTLLIDFTTISEKTVGGAHRPHADNCLHYFREVTNENGVIQKIATCDPNREHPYPNRVAASILYLNDPQSGNFEGGQFYFANRNNNGIVGEIVDVDLGRMVYFTSGVESLHGALPVQKAKNRDGNAQEEAVSRRLALAMWYVVDPLLEEYVPSFQSEPVESSKQSVGKPKKKYDSNDPDAPKELFVIPIPSNMNDNLDTLLQSMGSHLLSKQNTPSVGSWKVSLYGEDTLHVLFKDHSAMFSLDFGVALDDGVDDTLVQTSIVVERHTDGKKPPSLQYQLQESVILHGVLNELETLLKKGAGEDAQISRYVSAEVEKARKTLPARRA